MSDPSPVRRSRETERPAGAGNSNQWPAGDLRSSGTVADDRPSRRRHPGIELNQVITLGLAAILVAVAAAMAIPPAAPSSAARVVAPATDSTAESTTHVFREAVIGPVNTLNPLYARTRAELDLVALLFRGLTKLDDGSGLTGDLAQGWSVSSDGLTYIFHLRRDARWHDGIPVTADDVVYTILTLQHSSYQGPRAGSWRGVTAKKIDRLTVQFSLTSENAAFIALTTQPILPAHVLAGTPVAELQSTSFERQPIGCGPFRLVSLASDGAILERVPETDTSGASIASPPALPIDPRDWQVASTAAPGIDAVELTFVDDTDALVEAFRSGTVDAVGGLDADTARDLAAGGNARVIRYPRTVLTSVVLNLRFGRTLFRSSHERLALLMSVDRDALVESTVGGMASRADALIPPTSWAFDREASSVVKYSRTAAAKQLQAAGWKRVGSNWDRPGANGAVSFELATLDRATNPIDYAVAQKLAAAWKVMGIKVSVVEVTAAEMVTERLSPGDFDAAVVDINLGIEPDLYALLYSKQAVSGGSNVAGYQSAALDPLLEAARKTGSQAARQKRLSALQKELRAEMPILPLFYADYAYVVRDTVSGPVPREISSPSDRFWDVITWRTAEPVGP